MLYSCKSFVILIVKVLQFKILDVVVFITFCECYATTPTKIYIRTDLINEYIKKCLLSLKFKVYNVIIYNVKELYSFTLGSHKVLT